MQIVVKNCTHKAFEMGVTFGRQEVVPPRRIESIARADAAPAAPTAAPTAPTEQNGDSLILNSDSLIFDKPAVTPAPTAPPKLEPPALTPDPSDEALSPVTDLVTADAVFGSNARPLPAAAAQQRQ